jgi:hypothetical protein
VKAAELAFRPHNLPIRIEAGEGHVIETLRHGIQFLVEILSQT